MNALARRIARHWAWWLLSLLLGLSFVLAVALGSSAISTRELVAALMGQPLPGYKAEIILSLRLPRALLAAAVGAVLAMCGTWLQGLFRNPLADPSLIGVTAGASVGASLVIFLGSTGVGMLAGLSLVSLGAFTGGLITVWLVYRVATSVSGTSVATMLLMGIAASALAASFTGLMEFFADNEALRRMSLWRMGALDAADYPRAILMLVILALLLVSMPRFALALNTLLLGESQARHLGIDVERLKTRLILLVAAGVGLSVALAGSIAFVGLVVPHMLRLWVGPDHRLLLPLSALGGASLLLLADTLARVAVAPTELPVGLVTALVGAPFFIYLLYQRRGGMQ
ncbi:FecCD family ABC transporter permease [Cellvibrio japonicus]|uniref:Probable permease of ABC transporter n=1 Tax=Cellvibrio japonicus (strain Ueda107) TaxID=498211 RepID=B3PIP0_CELJU|nr:iron ABC transporter permease [Cellvibrio japonicus]ACE85022.1 probable permease of ABC transporter [Cellvibrio japonicus Ueda107]QEI13958.1 iron ABC transporter permease [Cellvibrio japonicus]QEI17532.1 iron ABC transporter permease [Cellvibrio japonicus]QEI21108.1 iron ABC transporter permease [Cellvibrio japonicus]